MAPTVEALIRHIVVGGLWHPVKRRAERELIAELTEGRYPSFPFISPDAFRALCDVVIENQRVLRQPRMATRSLIYFDLSEVEGTETSFTDSPSLELLEKELMRATAPPTVVMSHGDLVPTNELLDQIAELSHMVFSINLSEETERVRAIPLGLENLSRNINGRLTDFFQFRDNPTEGSRSRDVFTAFEPDNNPSIRRPLVELLRSSRFGWNPRRLKPDEYRKAVRGSLFVLSPPGRGLDCHRTWEAIYLGAVPVVLEGSLPTGLLEDMPIHCVQNYEDFLNFSHQEMLQLFDTVRSRGTRKAFMPFWVESVLASSHE